MKNISQFIKQQDGATAIEYALIAALIAIAGIAAMTTLGNNVRNSFSKVSSTLSSVNR